MAKKRVIAGVDGSPSSLEALRTASMYAQLLDADLRVVTTWNYSGVEDVGGVWDPQSDARAIGRNAAHSVFGAVNPAWVTLVTKVGPAAEALVDESEGAALLVVGSRGRNALTGLLLGSVSTHCAEHAHCPVLVVHEHDRARARRLVGTAAEKR